MRHLFFLIVLLLYCNVLSAQENHLNPYAIVDEKALRLPDSLTANTQQISKYFLENFSTDEDKVRAIFVWLASNINYDTDIKPTNKFYETKEEKTGKSLANRKGSCQNYAALFQDICEKTGIESYIVEGYTKQRYFIDYIPHAWCAAKIKGLWMMFDPTWGAGYMLNGQYFKVLNQ